jgi:hypothetical protein
MPAARKYRNILTVVDGKTFDSKAEARRYRELKLMQQAGEISGFGEQPSFIIGPEIRYRPDFIVCDRQGQVWVEDVKGKETAAFVIKAKLFRERYPWLPLKIIK